MLFSSLEVDVEGNKDGHDQECSNKKKYKGIKKDATKKIALFEAL